MCECVCVCVLSAAAHLPSAATEESGRANHLPKGRKFSFSNDLYTAKCVCVRIVCVCMCVRERDMYLSMRLCKAR